MEFDVTKTKLSSIFELSKLGMTRQLELYEQEDSIWTNTIPVVNKQYIFGLELETENVQPKYSTDVVKYENYCKAEVDNSLRNHGIEFITVPLKAYQIEHALDQLHSIWNVSKLEWSSRTSTHVHVNARDLDLNQILNFVLIYCAVEKLLFNWVGKDRDKNIFCIPLYKTRYNHAIGNLSLDPVNVIHNWNKYTALNLLPLEQHGTLEFRHLYGTWDKKIIITWTNLISCIKKYAKNITTHNLKEEIFSLNTTSDYEGFVRNVFDKYAELILQPQLLPFMEDTVSFCKMCLATQRVIFSNTLFRRNMVDWERIIEPRVLEEEVIDNQEVTEVEGIVPTPNPNAYDNLNVFLAQFNGFIRRDEFTRNLYTGDLRRESANGQILDWISDLTKHALIHVWGWPDSIHSWRLAKLAGESAEQINNRYQEYLRTL